MNVDEVYLQYHLPCIKYIQIDIIDLIFLFASGQLLFPRCVVVATCLFSYRKFRIQFTP